jgi:hypothetical protein
MNTRMLLRSKWSQNGLKRRKGANYKWKVIHLLFLLITYKANTSLDTEDEETDIDVSLELGSSVDVINGVEFIVKNMQGDPTDLDDSSKMCVQRFKAARKDDQKGMFSCFAEAGIFTSVCKHGLVILWCDMIHSGEL